MTFNFDKIINRRNTHSAKWDAMAQSTGVDGDDALAMWVADMDFEAPPAVKEALMEEVERSVHGYYAGDITWRTAMSNFLNRHHNWQPDPDWIVPTPGIVSALGLILQAVSEKNDSVVIFSPVYHAFEKIIKANERQVFQSPLVKVQGRYQMDLESLKNSLPKNAKVVFFCSPHNPGGTVWTKQEIEELANFCIEHDLILLADEIHHDLVYPGAKHLITATTVPQIEDRLFTTVAASKTFNLAGAHVGAIITSNSELRS
ncbi:MAG: MalY/PatB family protein, partial [Nitratireductor sp.]